MATRPVAVMDRHSGVRPGRGAFRRNLLERLERQRGVRLVLEPQHPPAGVVIADQADEAWRPRRRRAARPPPPTAAAFQRRSPSRRPRRHQFSIPAQKWFERPVPAAKAGRVTNRCPRDTRAPPDRSARAVAPSARGARDRRRERAAGPMRVPSGQPRPAQLERRRPRCRHDVDRHRASGIREVAPLDDYDARAQRPDPRARLRACPRRVGSRGRSATSASGTLGVTTSADRAAPSPSRATASSSQQRARPLSPSSPDRRQGSAVRARRIDAATASTMAAVRQHPGLDGAGGRVAGHGFDLRDDQIRSRPPPRRRRRGCSGRSRRSPRWCRRRPHAANVFRSAWRPAPPPESLPAIVSAVRIQ